MNRLILILCLLCDLCGSTLFADPPATTLNPYQAATTVAISGSGTTVLSRLGSVTSAAITIASGTAPYTASIILSDTAAPTHPGDEFLLGVSWPASTYPQLLVYDGTNPVAIYSGSGTATSGTDTLTFVNVSGTAWQHFPKDAVSKRMLGSGVAAALMQPVNSNAGLMTGSSSIQSGSSAITGITLTVSGTTLVLTGTGPLALAMIPNLPGSILTSGTVTIPCTTGTGGAFGSAAFEPLSYFATAAQGLSGVTNSITGLTLSFAGNTLTASGSSVPYAASSALSVATQSAGTVFAGPLQGSASAPAFRQLNLADTGYLALTASAAITLSSTSAGWLDISLSGSNENLTLPAIVTTATASTQVQKGWQVRINNAGTANTITILNENSVQQAQLFPGDYCTVIATGTGGVWNIKLDPNNQPFVEQVSSVSLTGTGITTVFTPSRNFVLTSAIVRIDGASSVTSSAAAVKVIESGAGAAMSATQTLNASTNSVGKYEQLGTVTPSTICLAGNSVQFDVTTSGTATTLTATVITEGFYQ